MERPDRYKVETYFFPEKSAAHDDAMMKVGCLYCKFDVFQAKLNTSFNYALLSQAIGRHESTWHADESKS